MAINWYPGHMHKARKELARAAAGCQVLFEVLDARLPLGSSNPVITEIWGRRPRIRLLNKADLAEPEALRAWQAYLEQGELDACLLNSSDDPIGAQAIVQCAEHLWQRSELQARGDKTMLIAGIPNVGKSTLLNRLAGRKVARTGNEPAVTRGQQRIRLESGWAVIDTPGLLWPRLDDQDNAYKLACLGSIRNTAIELDDVGWYLAELLLRDYRKRLEARYEIEIAGDSTEQLLQKIAARRGTVGRQGKADLYKTAEVLLNDFRSGKLGLFCLETPRARM